MAKNRKIKEEIILPDVLGIYIRVSTQQQVKDGNSPIAQRKLGEEKARELGWTFIIYDDSGKSGGLSIKDRPAMDDMLIDLDDKKLGGIYTVDIDRLSRDYADSQQILGIIKKSGVRFFTSQGEQNLNDEATLLISNILGVVAASEREKTKRKVSRGLRRSMIEGNNAGGGSIRAYGYDRKYKKLVINKDEAEVVKTIFEMALNEKGCYTITNYLNQNNIPTKRNNLAKEGLGGQMRVGRENKNDKGKVITEKKIKAGTEFKWRESVVYSILTNPIYKGQKQYLDLVIDSPIIIEAEKFDAVQTLLSTGRKFKGTPYSQDEKKKTGNKFLLKGLIQCGGGPNNPNCEMSFYGKQRKDLKDKAYVCLSQRYRHDNTEHQGFCGNRGIDIDYLNKIVLETINKMQSHANEFFKFIEKDENIKKTQADIIKYKKEIKDIENEMSDYSYYAFKNKFSDEIVSKKRTEFENQIKALNIPLQKCLRDTDVLTKKPQIMNRINQYFIELNEWSEKGLYNEIPFERWQQLVRAFVNKITIKANYYKETSNNQSYSQSTHTHIIDVELKIDELTNFRLDSLLEVEYKKNGHRIGVNTETLKLTTHIKADFENDTKTKSLDNTTGGIEDILSIVSRR